MNYHILKQYWQAKLDTLKEFVNNLGFVTCHLGNEKIDAAILDSI